MDFAKETTPPEAAMGALDAIYRRRAVREYAPGRLTRDFVNDFLDAAVHAPTAMHEEPRACVVIQDQTTLNRLSDAIKTLLTRGEDPIHPRARRWRTTASPPGRRRPCRASRR